MPETAAIKKQREKEGRGKLLTTLLIIETFLLCIGIILFLNPQELIKTSLFYKISPATYILTITGREILENLAASNRKFYHSKNNHRVLLPFISSHQAQLWPAQAGSPKV